MIQSNDYNFEQIRFLDPAIARCARSDNGVWITPNVALSRKPRHIIECTWDRDYSGLPITVSSISVVVRSFSSRPALTASPAAREPATATAKVRGPARALDSSGTFTRDQEITYSRIVDLFLASESSLRDAAKGGWIGAAECSRLIRRRSFLPEFCACRAASSRCRAGEART